MFETKEYIYQAGKNTVLCVQRVKEGAGRYGVYEFHSITGVPQGKWDHKIFVTAEQAQAHLEEAIAKLNSGPYGNLDSSGNPRTAAQC